MSFEIYTPDFSNRHEIGHAISIKSEIYYNDIGKISMILPINQYNIDNVKIGCTLLDKETFDTFIIQRSKIDTASNLLTVNGYTTNWLLTQRVVAQKKNFKTVQDIYDFVNENLRGLPNVEVASGTSLTDKLDSEILDGELESKVIYLLNTAGLGHKMIWDAKRKKHIFTIYKGKDQTSGIHKQVFSDMRGTAKNLVIADDMSTLKTTFYISGKTTDDRRIIEIIGNEYQGGDRREKWIRQVPTQDSKETEQQFRQSLREAAKEEVEKFIRRENFEVEINSDEFGTQYGLGDIVCCVSNRFDVQFNKRISGKSYTLDSNGATAALILGSPEINILEEERLKNA